MKEYYIYFTQLNGGSRIETIVSRSLLGAKQKASRIFMVSSSFCRIKKMEFVRMKAKTKYFGPRLKLIRIVNLIRLNKPEFVSA